MRDSDLGGRVPVGALSRQIKDLSCVSLRNPIRHRVLLNR
jgi:hypothetical protein